MAIIGIDSLEEITKSQLGENDMIPVYNAESNEVKKINANSLGGGAEDFVVEFDIESDQSTGQVISVSCNKTVREIATAYRTGKNIKGITHSSGNIIFTFSTYDFKNGEDDSDWQSGNSAVSFYAYVADGVFLDLMGEYNYQEDTDNWSVAVYMMNSI